MRYLSLFSGIEAASVAWKSLGWECVGVAEVDKFCCALLKHHYPTVLNLGDVTSDDFIDRAKQLGPIDLVVFGSPCQSFSIAGKRLGLNDSRGNLAIYALRVIAALRPTWFVFENVPGLLSSWSSDSGEDVEESNFADFLCAVEECGYSGAWESLDAQWFGVPQRRERVFFVGHSGDWRYPAAVFSVTHCLSGNPAPSRTPGQRFTHELAPSLTSSGRGVERSGESRGQDPVLAMCLTAGGHSRNPLDEPLITATLTGNPYADRASEESLLVTAPTLTSNGDAHSGYRDERGLVPIGFTIHGTDKTQRIASQTDLAGCVRARTPGAQENSSTTVALAFNLRGRDGGSMPESTDVASLRAANGGSSRSFVADTAVRRLTPRECERLQGFPDDYTNVPFRGKPSADGPRYRALGNSMAVPVMSWIGKRIQQAEAATA